MSASQIFALLQCHAA